MEKARGFQENIYFCFIDYAKAFVCVDHNKLWKILKEMRIPDYLFCLLRNLYADQEATVRTEHETMNWLKLRKEYVKAVYCHSAYLTYMQSTSDEMPGWMKHNLELINHINSNQRKTGIAILASDKVNFGAKKMIREGQACYWMTKESIHQEDTTILNVSTEELNNMWSKN